MSKSIPGTVLLAGLLIVLPGSVSAAEHEYANPVVFQRFDAGGGNAATPDIPGFYGGASIWVMEADGSMLKMLRHPGAGPSARHLDHPSVTSDGRFVIYAEFDSAEVGREGVARLYREDLLTGERSVLREQAGCSLHHASLSLDDAALTYARDCGRQRSLITEVGGEPIPVESIEEGASAGNGVSARNRVVFQSEKRVPGQTGRTIAIILTEIGHDGEIAHRMLADWEFRDRRATVSQDGNLVAWQTNSTTGGGTDDIVLLDLEDPDAEPVKLTESPANDGHPWFSRDGDWLLFESDRTGNWEIFTLHIPTGDVAQLTNDPDYVSTRPRW